MTSTTPEAALPLTASGRVDGRSARKIETRRKIIFAAADLFAEAGYAGTSMDDIAEAAGVSKGTIFYNFKNKAELFEQLLRHSVTVISQDMVAARQGLTGWAALTEAMWSVIQFVEANPSFAMILLNELFRAHRPWVSALREDRAILAQPLTDILEELAVEREQVAGRRALGARDAHGVAMSLLGALVVATLDHKAFEADRPLREVHAGLMMAIHGMNPALAATTGGDGLTPGR